MSLDNYSSPGSVPGPGTGPGPGSVSNTGLENGYIDLQSQSGELRYAQEHTAPSLTLDQHQQSSLLNLYPNQASVLDTTGHYPQDGNYYQHTSHLFPNTNIDVRSRLGSNTASATGMAHNPRTSALPHPGGHQGPHISAREQYAHATPSFRRPSEHPIRSPSYSASAFRRHHISPSPSISAGAFANPASRMDSANYGPRPSSSTGNTIPPLEDMITLGTLNYQDPSRTAAKISVNGCIDKGFFQADGEWTCYRRNYFSCVCHYSISPYYPGVPLEYTPATSARAQASTIQGFAMCISAIVADSDQHTIELVQHTPKRDKGPTKHPPRVPLMAKPDTGTHSHVGIYTSNATLSHNGANLHYPDGWAASESAGNAPQTECTFERIQFKQATQNNGKRRAAQQYYHLIIELWANIGTIGAENWIKVAYRKSAKMIVRGRSPGHYQNDRRGSSSHGPSGSAGNVSNFHGLGGMGEFNTGSMLNNYNGYNAQGSVYAGHHHRHHAVPAEVAIPQEEQKEIESTKAYQYYPGSIYDSQVDQKVDMFNHHSESEPVPQHVAVAGGEMSGKEKFEYDHGSGRETLPRLVHPPLLSSDRRRCGPFDGKSSSAGYYPHVLSPSSMSITMT